MDKQDFIGIIPHYIAMLVLVSVVFLVIASLFGEISFWIELLIIFVVVSLYRLTATRFGFAPNAWNR